MITAKITFIVLIRIRFSATVFRKLSTIASRIVTEATIGVFFSSA